MSGPFAEVSASSLPVSEDELVTPPTASWAHMRMWDDIRIVLQHCSINTCLSHRFHDNFWNQHSPDQRDLLVSQWQFRSDITVPIGRQHALLLLRTLMPRVTLRLCQCMYARGVVSSVHTPAVQMSINKRKTME